MPHISNTLGDLSTDGVQGLHYERAADVGLSAAIKKPIITQLCALPTLADTELPSDYERVIHSFTFAYPARTLPIVYNSNCGMIVSTNQDRDKVWAHIYSGYGDKVFCDGPHRAFVLFQSVGKSRVVQCLSSLEQVHA